MPGTRPGMTAEYAEGMVAKLKVMCARSMHLIVGELGAAFGKAAGHDIAFDFGTVGGLEAKIAAGETADVYILSVGGIGKMEKAEAVVPGSRKEVAKTFIALCVREGAPIPQFGTLDAFRKLLESAKAVATSDPAVGGSAGVHLDKAFKETGLESMMAPKAMPQKTGAEVAKRVVEGKADFGLTLSGEVASVPGAVIAGPLPAPFGQDTIYCAAVRSGSAVKDAASDFIAALTKPDTRAAWKKAGFEKP
ncbi:substrate-binding domain-containing protein [Leptospira sp. severe_002]|uniref:molybdate ABC transporter substrate-binding protein n=1 Tax=Leptospira sp. severe_002 TaxID=2838237 RepID=UPI001E361498|nr:substrate-binding domain-containing protein [Leptospira sp. severe_002]